MYTTLDPRHTQNLVMARDGLVNPEFALIDDSEAVYGKLFYRVLKTRSAFVETIANRWTFKSQWLSYMNLDILDENEYVLGEVLKPFFGRRITLRLNDGFTVIFYRTSWFSREWICESAAEGKILQMRTNLLQSRYNFQLIGTSTLPVETLTLLIFLTAHLNLMRQRQKG